MSLRKILYAPAVALLAGSASAHDFSTCDSNLAGVTAVTLTPDPPQAGKNLVIQVTGQPSVAVTDMAGEIKITCFGITVDNQKFDLCKDSGVTCPVSKGSTFNGKLSYSIPSAAPRSVTLHAEVTVDNGDGSQITCLDLTTSVQSSEQELVPPQSEAIVSGNTNGQATARGPLNDEEALFLFEAWRAQHGLEFSWEEVSERFSTWRANLDRIIAHNQRDDVAYTLAMDKYGIPYPSSL